MKVLILYCDYENVSVGDIFPKDTKIVKMKIYDYLEKHETIKNYDAIVSIQSLQKVEPINVPDAIEWFWDSLNKGGELYVYVPALEWMAQQFFSPKPSLILNVVLFGPRENPNRSGFTLAWLRLLVEATFRLVQVTQGKFEIQMKNEKGEISKFQFLQNMVIGQKVEKKDAPAPGPDTAIS